MVLCHQDCPSGENSFVCSSDSMNCMKIAKLKPFAIISDHIPSIEIYT